ncbi:MAG: L-threonylcarbamoyladenylate synthase [Raoultibacter sp.]
MLQFIFVPETDVHEAMLSMGDNELQDAYLASAVATLSAGQAIIFPTDTVYGLGVAVGLAQSPAILYDIKARDHGKPVAWLVGSPEALALYGEAVPEFAFAIARAYWPGPMTLIVKAGANVPEAFRAEGGTIALRMPDNEISLRLIERVGMPLATTSANISGQQPPKTFSELDRTLLERVRVVLRDETEKSGIASTIIDCTQDAPVMVREGDVSLADIEALLS